MVRLKGSATVPLIMQKKESPVMGSLFVKKIIILMVDYFNPHP